MKVFENFKALKELNPTWYYNLYPENAKSFSTCYYNSAVMKIPEEYKKLVTEDTDYSNKTSKELDLGFQLWNRGILLYAENIEASKLSHKEKPSLLDNYIFIRKYYKKRRTYYFFLKNILSLNNPFKEIRALVKTKNTPKGNLSFPHCKHENYESFDSQLIKSNPLVSIIIPTLNRYEYLKDAIDDLEKQDYKNHEIIIVDQTDNPDKEFYNQYDSNVCVIYQEGKGQWLARNAAALKSKGDYILFFDDDSRVDPDWISHHLKCLDYFKADISAGVSLSTVGDSIPENYSFFRWADQFDSGNALVSRKVFEKTGLFDRQFDRQRMGDGEFGLRAYLAGFRSISNPLAKRIHLKIGTGGLRQMGSWDAFRPKKFFSPRPIPSVLYLYRKYFPPDYVINALILGILPSMIPYKWKSKKYLIPLSIIVLILILPVVMIQVLISWRRSSEMLKAGDKIGKI